MKNGIERADKQLIETALRALIAEHPNTTWVRSEINDHLDKYFETIDRQIKYVRTISQVLMEFVDEGELQRLNRGRYYLRPGTKRAKVRDPSFAEIKRLSRLLHRAIEAYEGEL